MVLFSESFDTLSVHLRLNSQHRMLLHNLVDVQLKDACQVLLTSTRPIFEALITSRAEVTFESLIYVLQSHKLFDIEDNSFVPQCPDCSEKFSMNSELIRHFKTLHKKDKLGKEINSSRNHIHNTVDKNELIFQTTASKKEEVDISMEYNESIDTRRSEPDLLSDTILKEVDRVEPAEPDLEEEDSILIYPKNGTNIGGASQKEKSDAKEELEKRRIHICHECGKKYTEPRYLRKHTEIEHQGIRYTCEHCKGKFKEPKYLQKHIAAVHLGKTIDCDKCDYKASHQEQLNNHIRSKHQGILYFCDQCEFKSSHKPYLTVHKKAKHDEEKLKCNQCDYKTYYSTQLYYHQDTKHNNKKFLCDQCDFVANVRAKLRYHVKTKHT